MRARWKLLRPPARSKEKATNVEGPKKKHSENQTVVNQTKSANNSKMVGDVSGSGSTDSEVS